MGLLLQGAHRGGTRFMARVSADVLENLGNHLIVADPHPGRSAFLSREAENRFSGLEALALETTGRRALPFVGADDPLVLASDSIGSLRDTLADRQPSHPAFWQIVGRGPGGGSGSRIGLQGTLLPGDGTATADSELLLDALQRLAPPVSSRTLTGTDALAATVLAPMRDRAIARTLRHLKERERDPADLTGGALGIVCSAGLLPLKPVQSEPGLRYRQQKALALDALDGVPEKRLLDRNGLGKYLTVGLVETEGPAVHLFTVSRSRTGRRRVEGIISFEQAPAVQASPAVFTD